MEHKISHLLISYWEGGIYSIVLTLRMDPKGSGFVNVHVL